MKRFASLIFSAAMLAAAPVTGPVEQADGQSAVAETAPVQPGVSGRIVRHFNDEHSAIIAEATVRAYDADTGKATLELRPYGALAQNALPHGEWAVRPGDEAVLAFAYERALLLSPDGDIYHDIVSQVRGVEWVHPDLFAAFLSSRGHPSPQAEDLQSFCAESAIGLLYLYLEGDLITLDCRSLRVLQVTPTQYAPHEELRPFYTRIDTIREGWWGEGSDPISSFAAHYKALVRSHNADNPVAHDLTKEN